MTTSTLPVSPIAPTSSGPAAQAGVVQINLNATTGQIVTGAEFGLATTMGDLNHDYLPYADPAFQAVADQYPTDLLRHNWELNTMMDILYPSRSSASSPNFTDIDNYLKQQGNLTGFFNNNTGTQVVTLGFPSWLDISNPADQQLYGNMVKAIAQHFIAMGEPIADYELVNEPDGQYTATDMANTFNVVAQALKSVDPSYKLGGLTETYPRMDDLQTFFKIAGPNIGFVSYHQYVTNGSDGKSDQQVVSDSLTASIAGPQQVRALMQASGIPNSVPIFLGEYNVDGANFDDPNNGNMVGAVAAAAVTYGMIASDSNATMGALWCVINGSAYSAFGGVGNYQADPVGVVLSDLTQYMPGNIVQTTMPSNTPGLVGYTTTDGQGFSMALIDTNLTQGYTVDLSHDGLPTTGLFRVEVSNANPGGAKTAITDLSHVSVAAGSVVIITDEAPHGGVEFTGTPVATPTPTPSPTPGSTPTPGPTSTPSPDGTEITTAAASPIIDPAGNALTLVQSASNGLQIAVDGIVDQATRNVVLLQLSGGKIVQENASGNWYSEPAPGAGWTQIAGPGAPPSPPAPPSAPPPPSPPSPPAPSPDGTKITTAAASPIIDPAGNALTLVQSASNGLQIAVNGTVDQTTRNVVLLQLSGGNIVQENANGFWYSETAPGAAWTHIAAPAATPAPPSAPLSPSPSAPSPDGTKITTAAASPIMDSSGNALTLVQSASNGLQIAVNGTVDQATRNVVLLQLSGGKIVQENASGNWYSEPAPGAGWTQIAAPASAPTPVTPPPPAPITTGSGSDTLVLTMSEDAYQGDAQFTVSVDGKQLGGTFTAAASHASGAGQDFTFRGDWATGTHVVTVNFLNDAYGGSPSTDRNLYVNGISYDGTATGQSAVLLGNGPVSFPISDGPASSAGGETFDLTEGSAATVTLGTGASQLKFIGAGSLTLVGGSGQAVVTAGAGSNKFIAGTGSLDVTGGSGKDAYVFHANSGLLTLEDFSIAKGDTLTIDKALQGSLQQTSDGRGGTMLTFGAGANHGVDIHGMAAMPTTDILWA